VSEALPEYLLQHLQKPEHSSLKSEKTRQDILRAALEFILDHSFHELTVCELMTRAGHSRPVFYQYYSDLHAVMLELLTALQQAVLDVAFPWLEGTNNTEELLRQSIRGMMEACYELGPVLRAVAEAASADPRMAEHYAAFMQVFDDSVTENIQRLQQLGEIETFEAAPVAVILNRTDAATVIDAFGRQPRKAFEPVVAALTRVWCSTLYAANATQS